MQQDKEQKPPATGDHDGEPIRGDRHGGRSEGAEPVFNLPAVITWLIALLFFIHGVRVFLPLEIDFAVIMAFAFIPASYGPLADTLPFPWSGLWSPLTYGFLHGGWAHLIMNTVWMAAFGAVVAKRVGAWRFLGLSLAAAIGGAAAHYLFFIDDIVPVIGASGAVSGHMGAASRFAFNNLARRRGFRAEGPALSLAATFVNRQFLIFFTVWMLANYIFGAGVIGPAGEEVSVAWQAHIGGFLVGLLLFSVFDPSRHRRPDA